VIRTFVALGDSFTEGLEDEIGPAGRHLGWADRVAAELARTEGSLRYANLAVRGRLLDQVVAAQLPVALELAPDLASFHAGPNDLLRPRADLSALLARYDAAVGTFAGAGIRTVLFTVVERTGTGRTADRLAARFHAFNVGVRATAERYEAVLVDLAAVPVLRDRRLWHEDRLHLAPEGHARVAAAVLEALGVSRSAGAGRAASLVADVRWIRVHLLPWIGRRIRGVSSGDRITAKHAELVDIIPD
jgi:lysophospholipase L1-like esterase